MSAPIITRPVQGAAPNQFITIEADQAELQRVVDEIYATANPEDRERAEDAADRSQAWAESPTPPDPDDATSKSSKTWAETAETVLTGIIWYITDDTTSVTVGVGLNVVVQDPGPGPYETVTLEVA